MDPVTLKHEFTEKLGGLDQILPLLDSIHDISFFFKDRQSRQVMNNLRAVASAGVSSEEETIGKIGWEFWHSDKMALYLMQDEQVMSTGKPIINALCPSPERGSNAVIIFSKIPLRDKKGEIIGLAGVWREMESMEALPPVYHRFSAIIQMLHKQYSENITIQDMAKKAGMSRSQFGRVFRKLFGLSPSDYLTSVRLHAATELLRKSDLLTTDIAINTGFYDHSHFSRTFKKNMNITPRDYRKLHAY